MNPPPSPSFRAPKNRRRQWGSERRRDPLPTVHAIPSDLKITWARLAIVLTVIAWAAYVVSTIIRQFIDEGGDFRFTMEAISYVVVVTFLTFSALMYLVARQGRSSDSASMSGFRAPSSTATSRGTSRR